MFVALGRFTKSCGRADGTRINAVGKLCIRIHARQVILCVTKNHLDVFDREDRRDAQSRARLRETILSDDVNGTSRERALPARYSLNGKRDCDSVKNEICW